MKIKYIIMGVCMTLFMCGCNQAAAPQMSPTQTMEAYLTALKKQNSVEMAKYTISGKADDFQISDAESRALGLQVDTAKKFTDMILRFDYTLTNEQIQKDSEQASVDVQIKTYDVLNVLESTAENKKEEFQEIYRQDGSNEEKSEQISLLLLDGFHNAEKTYEATITLHMRKQEGVWKISDTMDQFYTQLLNTAVGA